jgi:hypothetical protein
MFSLSPVAVEEEEVVEVRVTVVEVAAQEVS